MHGLKDSAARADVCPRHQPQPADKRRAQVRDDVAVKVFHHQHVILVRIHHQLHAGVVNDVLTVSDLREFLVYLATATQKQAIAHLHDVGFVNSVDTLAFFPARVLKRKTGNAGGSLLGNDLQRLHYARHDFMLNAGVLAFSIFATDGQVHAGITRGQGRQIADGTEVGEKFELLAQRDVDAGEPAADRRGDRALQPYSGALNGLGKLLGDVLAVFGIGL